MLGDPKIEGKTGSIKLTYWQVDEMMSRQNDESMKWLVDEMMSRWNDKLMKWRVDKMMSWRNNESTKQRVDEMTSRWNVAAPIFFVWVHF